MKTRFSIAITLGCIGLLSPFISAQPARIQSQPRLPAVRASEPLSVPRAVQQTKANNWKQASQIADPAIAYPPGYKNSNRANQAPSVYATTNTFSVRDTIQPKVEQKLRQYRSAKSSSDKSKLEKELESLLEKQFDARLKQPLASIKNSRKRLVELTEQHETRESKSSDIVALRLNVLLNEAKGLGWHSGHSANQFTYAVPHNYPTTWRPSGTNPLAFRPSTITAPAIANKPYYVPGGQPVRAAQQYSNSQLLEEDLPKETKDKSQHEILAEIKKATDASEKKTLTEALRKSLDVEFEKHQTQIQKQIDHIEKQVSDLEENIEKRKNAKDAIVELKLKTLINQANGLGF